MNAIISLLPIFKAAECTLFRNYNALSEKRFGLTVSKNDAALCGVSSRVCRPGLTFYTTSPFLLITHYSLVCSNTRRTSLLKVLRPPLLSGGSSIMLLVLTYCGMSQTIRYSVLTRGGHSDIINCSCVYALKHNGIKKIK